MKVNVNIRRTLLLECMGNTKLTKAIALAIKVKLNVSSSRIDSFSYNKLHKITGLHPMTLKKRMETLRQHGLLRWEGNSVIFCTISSRHRDRNVFANLKGETGVKDIEYHLASVMLVVIQSRKDFVAHTLLTAQGHGEDSHSLSKVKAARRKCRALRIRDSFRDFGISYKTIGRKIGVCAKTAAKRVDFACRIGKYLTKKRNYYFKEMEGASIYFDYIPNGFTYCFGNLLFRPLPNTYQITRKGNKVLG